jgi:heavy metal sensor kinase
MTSIRRSLLFSFLLLLGLVLSAVSVLAYRQMEQILHAREGTRRLLLETQHEDKRRREESKLDEALLYHAHSLAGQAQYQFKYNRGPLRAMGPLLLLGSGLDPNVYHMAPVWLAERGRGRLSEYLSRMAITAIQFNEEALPRFNEEVQSRYAHGHANWYFQINAEYGTSWRSRSMAERTFPFDLARFAATPLHDPRYDDTELEPGVSLRRVILKAPAARLQIVPANRRRGDRPPQPPPGPREPQELTYPAIFIQCAAETGPRDAALQELQARFDEDLADITRESHTTLASFRDRLLLISLVTFAVAVAGGLWLIQLGLAPLSRLSEAVSRISARDFRLPFEEKRTPREVRPIVERLTDTLHLLKRAFAREKQAAADISHELRTPIAALLTTLEVGLRKPRSPEEYREMLTDCHATGQHLSKLVERLLLLARLDAGVDLLRPQPIDGADLVEECAALVRPLAEERGLQLHVHRNGPIPLHADPDKLHEIVSNLLHNAIEYNRPGGSIDVAVEREDGHVQLDVRDTGIGMAPGTVERIFERFFRADPARQADGLHAGLGLAIVRSYLDRMGGTIAVESREGEGSTFSVRLPAG